MKLSTNVEFDGFAKSGVNVQSLTPSEPLSPPSYSSSQKRVKTPGVPAAGAGPSRCGGWIPSGQSFATHGRLNFTKVAFGSPATMAWRSNATALEKSPSLAGKSRSDK